MESKKEARRQATARRGEWVNKHKILSAGIIVLIFFYFFYWVIGNPANTASSASQPGKTNIQTTPTPPTTTLAPTATTVAVARIGQVVQDGDFAFGVGAIRCGASATAAVVRLGETVPNGAQECLVAIAVTNDKRTAQTYFTTNQYAFDSAGHKLSADPLATIYLTGALAANDDTQINPGVTITAIVPFQISTTDKITSLELHDSAFSSGVRVNLQ